MSRLTWENIDAIIRDSLLDDVRDGPLVEEMRIKAEEAARVSVEESPEKFAEFVKWASDNGIIIAESCMQKIAFVGARLESHRTKLQEMIQDLDPAFLQSEGGGWSFLNLPMNKDGEQWGEQWQADLFFSACSALGLAGFCIEDRQMWAVMPGGMPYVYFKVNK